MNDDEKVARRYRELGAEEPPRALDEAILAAARHPRAGKRRPARPWTQRWAVPLSLAAVLVLSVTVTLRMQQERPGIESPAPQAKVKEPAPAVPAAEAQSKPKMEAQRKKPVARKEPEPFANAVQDKVAADQPPAAAAPPPAAAPVAAEMRASRRDAAQGAASNLAGALAETPERELERIAELRKQGRQDEADKALAEFRKRHPDYKIPAAMLERVERR